MEVSNKLLSLQHSLMDVWHSGEFYTRPFNDQLRQIIRSCAEQLDASRVSVWSLSEDRKSILCQALYQAAANRYEYGQAITAESAPAYFDAIRQERLIVANDARRHPQTREFTKHYLEPLEIYSMLDVPIYSCGSHYGVICIEYTGAMRDWDLAEMAYAIAVADRISLFREHQAWIHEREKLELAERMDPHTGLEIRRFFQQRVGRSLETLTERGSSAALIIFELENFKTISNTWGLGATIEMIRELADRLQKLPELNESHLARTSGDCFAVWTPTVSTDTPVEQLIQRIKAVITSPISVVGHGNIRFTICMGVSIYPTSDFDLRDPLRHAEIALAHAKTKGKNAVTFFDKQWSEANRQRTRLEEALFKAIGQNEIIPYYQPIVDASTQKIVGAEALMRWRHPTMDILLPGDFFSIAREAGLMASLGDIMMTKVCEDLRQCLAIDDRLWISINLSEEEFNNTNLVQDLSHLLEREHLPGNALLVEITEDLISHESDLFQQQAKALADLGLRLAIDDFGTGYSSLSRLKHLPLSKLKIDKSFTDGLPDDNNDVCITSSIIGLARGLNLATVGEGVETWQQADWLKQNGCNLLQGNYLARPQPLKEFLSLLNDEQVRSGTGVPQVKQF